MSDDFRAIVKPIVDEDARGEAHIWNTCQMIHDAYAEVGLHNYGGLTASLCNGMNRSAVTVHNRRRAWDMLTLTNQTKMSLHLHPSHAWTMHGLMSSHNLTVEQCSEWLQFAADERLTVEQLAEEVRRAHDGDPEKSYRKTSKRLYNSTRRWLDMAEFFGVPDDIRAAVKLAGDELRAWLEAMPKEQE